MNHKLLSLILLLWASMCLHSQPGTIDATFNPTDLGFDNGAGANGGTVYAMVLQPDGKILMGGDFTSYNGTARSRIARLNADGSLDTGFDPGTGINNLASPTVYATVMQPNGKILIGGDFWNYNGTARNRIARLNADGSLDTDFDSGTGANGTVRAMALQADGKILIGGDFWNYNGTARNRIARLNADGSLDTGFDPGTGASSTVWSMVLQQDGKILIGGQFGSYNGTARNRIARLNADGSLDTGFDPGTGASSSSSTVRSMVLQPDGKILMGGDFTSYNGTARNRIARLNADGSLDTGFDPGTGANNRVEAMALQQDGKILIGGQFASYNGTDRNRIARLNADGSLDTGFDPGTGASSALSPTVYALVLQPDGKTLMGGEFTSFNGTPRNGIARLNADGSLDMGFNPASGANRTVYVMALQADGKILIGGFFTSYNGTARNRIARLNAGGSLDTGFNPGTGASSTVYTMALQADGKILIGGDFTSFNGTARNRIARLNADGSLDTDFDPGSGANGTVRAMALQADGKILIGGGFTSYNGTTRNRIARLNADGSLDTGFNPGTGASSRVRAMALQADGKILIGGVFTSYNGTARNRIARLNFDGSLDAGFDPGTGVTGPVYATVMQPDGKILIGGSFIRYNGTARNFIARLNANGTLDLDFDSGWGANGRVYAMALQPDGKTLIGGEFTSYNGTGRNRIARLNTNGTLDIGFDPGTGVNSLASPTVYATVMQPDGKILIGGWFTAYDGTGRNRVARVSGGGVCSVSITSVTTTDETCTGANNGTLTATATCGTCSGGNANIRYSIDNNDFSNTTGEFTGLAPGTYTVYVHDVNDIICTDSDGPHTVAAGTDTEDPVAICPTTAPTVMLDGSGSGTLAANALAGGNSTDNCSTGLVETSPMASFTCADAPTATVVLTATDAVGNANTANCTVNIGGSNCCEISIANVTATDETCPGANDGTLTATATCGTCSDGNADIRYSIDNSDYSNTTGVFTGLAPGIYMVYVRDVNDDSCTDSDGQHTVAAGVDNEDPIAICPTTAPTVVLDGSGNGTLAANALTGGNSTDNCSAGLTETSPMASFTCADAPTATVVLTAMDAAGNPSTANCTVNIVDNTPPTITACPAARNLNGCDESAITGPAYSTTVATSDYATFSNATNQGETSDNCGIVEVTYQDVSSGTCPIVVTRTWAVKDAAGASETCEQTISISATPAVLTCAANATEASCQDQSAIDAAFATWLGTVSFSGGCNAYISDDNTGAPPACGGSTTVTWTVSSGCETDMTCSATFTVTAAPAVVLTCAADATEAACQDQSAIDAAFATWLGTVSFSGGCNASISNDATTAPLACGGSTTVTWTVSSDCEADVTCSATFTVAAAPEVTLTCAADATEAACQDQSTIDAAFATWLGTVSFSGGCDASISNDNTGVPPACGGSTTVTWTVSSGCETDMTCSATFTVTAVPAVVLTCAADATEAACQDQSAIDAAFATWLGTVSFSGGCNASSSNDATTAPLACGGSTTVTWTVSSDCEADVTCSATFTVTDAPTVVLECPMDATEPSCQAQTEINGAFALWLASATANGGCNTMVTNDVSMPPPAVGGSVTVTFTASSDCEADVTSIRTFTVESCFTITGNIVWEHDRVANPVGVPDAEVALTGDDTGNDNTDGAGGYAIPTLGGSSLTLTPTKTGNAYEGVDAADVTRIQQHVTFIAPFDDGYKVIAADVNQSNSVTGLDAAVLFHAINGNPSAQTIFETPSWRFVKAMHTFMDENEPWPFPKDISLTDVMDDMVDQDFVGVKMGDVNGTWATTLELLAPPLNWAVPDATLKAGQTLRVPFRATGLPDVAAWQFALRFDTDYLRFERALSTAAFPLKDENFGAWQAERGELRSVFAVPQGLVLPKGEVIFELEFQVVRGGLSLSEALRLDDEILDGLVYNTALRGGAVALTFAAVETRRIASLPLPGEHAPGFTIQQNMPNPFSNETLIRFQLPEAGEAVFSVHDVQGRLLYEQRGFFDAGLHEVRLDAELLGATGVLSYTLRCGAHSATRRMVVVR